MNRPVILAAAATLCLSAAYAQTEPPPNPSNSGQTPDDSTSPSSASSPHQRAVTGETGVQEATPSNGSNPANASSPHQNQSNSENPDPRDEGRERDARATTDRGMNGVTAGTRVRSPSGEAIGTVRDFVPDSRNGRADYVLIDTASGRRTAVPYQVLGTAVHNGEVVLDRSRLESAPVVNERELQDPSNTNWRKRADQYWLGTQPSSHDRG